MSCGPCNLCDFGQPRIRMDQWGQDNTRFGDVLLIWNMPYPVGSQVIYHVSGGHCDHCAICLGIEDGERMVYEAQPPVVRRMTFAEYMEQCDVWGGKRLKWRERKDKWLYIEQWRVNEPDKLNASAMLDFSNGELGVPYRMVIDYLWPGKKKWSQHCSKFAGMNLEKGGAVRGGWEKPYSKIEPMDVRNFFKFSGGQLVETIEV